MRSQPGEGPSRGLLRDYESSNGPLSSSNIYPGFTSTGAASSSPVFYLSYRSHSSITKYSMALGKLFWYEIMRVDMIRSMNFIGAGS